MKRSFAVMYGAAGAVGIALFCTYFFGFKPHEYFYNNNPDLTVYAGINVVSRWAAFSFFTYLTILIFSFWGIAVCLCSLVPSWKRALAFLLRDTVVACVFVNFLITTVVYTFFELIAEDITFGLYAHTKEAWHSFGMNMVGHYVLFVFVAFMPFTVKINRGRKGLACVLIPLALTVYFVAVKLTGMYSYRIEWYPYFLFLWPWWGLGLALLGFICIYFALYFGTLLLLSKRAKLVDNAR